MTAININNILNGIENDDDVIRTRYEMKDGKTLHILASFNEDEINKLAETPIEPVKEGDE